MANQRFENALQRVPQRTPPIWMMRQAGRYHNHYQKLRAKYSFMELCKEPELASEVALGPIQDFDFDVSIMFSDLLFPLEGLGMGLEYTEKGPRLGWNLNSENLRRLKSVEEGMELLKFQKYVLDATREKLPQEKSLIGFVGGPWTLYVYATEGGHSGNLLHAKAQPDLFLRFSEILVPLLIENIRLQLDAGAEIVMIFDTAAGELDPILFDSLVGPQLEKILSHFPGQIGYYAKGVTHDHYRTSILKNSAWVGMGYDHRFDLPKILSESVSGFVQGNFDQALLFASPDRFPNLLKNYLARFRELSPEQRAGWVCGLGHGILPATPEENVRSFVGIVREAF